MRLSISSCPDFFGEPTQNGTQKANQSQTKTTHGLNKLFVKLSPSLEFVLGTCLDLSIRVLLGVCAHQLSGGFVNIGPFEAYAFG